LSQLLGAHKLHRSIVYFLDLVPMAMPNCGAMAVADKRLGLGIGQ
jgi:hypothetical protein